MNRQVSLSGLPPLGALSTLSTSWDVEAVGLEGVVPDFFLSRVECTSCHVGGKNKKKMYKKEQTALTHMGIISLHVAYVTRRALIRWKRNYRPFCATDFFFWPFILVILEILFFIRRQQQQQQENNN